MAALGTFDGCAEDSDAAMQRAATCVCMCILLCRVSHH